MYIDGFNFFHGAVKGTQYKWLDIMALCQGMLPRDQIVKIRYFTSRTSARPGDPQQPVRQETYLRALATLPLVEIHYGHFVTRPVRLPRANRQPGESRTVEVLRTEEKGSDVNLATYLLLDAFKGSLRNRSGSQQRLGPGPSDRCRPIRTRYQGGHHQSASTEAPIV